VRALFLALEIVGLFTVCGFVGWVVERLTEGD
jgi:hypothetical protein